jgi:pilus assembly protein Flp/PilA
MNMLKKLFKDESGQGMVEYGLIIALIAILLIGALTLMSGSLEGIFGRITGELNDKAGSTTP